MAAAEQLPKPEISPAQLFDGLVGEAWTHHLLVASEYHGIRPLAGKLWDMLPADKRAELDGQGPVRFVFDWQKADGGDVGIAAGTETLAAIFFVEPSEGGLAGTSGSVPVKIFGARGPEAINVSASTVEDIETFLDRLKRLEKSSGRPGDFCWNFKKEEVLVQLGPAERAHLMSIEQSVDNRLFSEPTDLSLFRSDSSAG